MIKRLLYKAGQLFGMAATISLALGLAAGWLYEPNIYIKTFEVVGSLVAAIILGADILDIHPGAD